MEQDDIKSVEKALCVATDEYHWLNEQTYREVGWAVAGTTEI